jgi:hypothetical protein
VPLWHIIRTKNGVYQDKTHKNFLDVFGNSEYEFLKYDGESEIGDINAILKNPPHKHTIIFIKEMLRCAKTLVKNYLGIGYERCSKKPDDASINQGIVGRLTGYDDNGMSICYTNIDSIERYEQLWISNFENKNIKWNSKTTKYVNGILSGKHTFNDPREYDGFSVDSDESDDTREPTIKICTTQDEVKKYYTDELKENLGGRGPNKIKPCDSGFYEATIRSNKRVYSCDEILAERKQGLNDKNYRLYPCYRNIHDISTLEWWIIHY